MVIKRIAMIFFMIILGYVSTRVRKNGNFILNTKTPFLFQKRGSNSSPNHIPTQWLKVNNGWP